MADTHIEFTISWSWVHRLDGRIEGSKLRLYSVKFFLESSDSGANGIRRLGSQTQGNDRQEENEGIKELHLWSRVLVKRYTYQVYIPLDKMTKGRALGFSKWRVALHPRVTYTKSMTSSDQRARD